MYVVSQNKKVLIEPKGFIIDELGIHDPNNWLEERKKYTISGVCNGDEYKLGIYKTEERALEVLDELIKEIKYCTSPVIIFEMPEA